MNQAQSAFRHIRIGPLEIGNNLPLVLIAGPCVLESREHAFEMAGALAELARTLSVGFIYKTSFDKANRTSEKSFRGIGLTQALQVMADIRATFGCPVLTDIHQEDQCSIAAEAVDILQIPAFLSRQTDLLVAAARTGKVINVKKGQFLAPWDMQHVVAKVDKVGNANLMLCERGVSFGYNTLVSDMRSLPILKQTGCPVVFDATHSVQQPGGRGASSGGERHFVPVLARAAVSLGIAALFVETHQDPDKAPSDGPNMIPLKDMPAFMKTILEFDTLAKKHPLF